MPDVGARLMRRIQHMLGVGSTSTTADDAGGGQTVQFQSQGMSSIDRVPVMHPYGFSSSAPIGSTALRMSMMGDLSSSVIIGHLHHGSRPRGLLGGQTTIYDQAGSRVTLTNDGNIELVPNGGKVIIRSDLEVEGEVTAKATTAPVKVSTHRHAGVEQGEEETQAPIEGT